MVRKLEQDNSLLFDKFPGLVDFVPDTCPSTSKRIWERSFGRCRKLCRLVREVLETGGRRVCDEVYSDLLTTRPHFRDYIPNPYDDSLADSEWVACEVEAFLLLRLASPHDYLALRPFSLAIAFSKTLRLGDSARVVHQTMRLRLGRKGDMTVRISFSLCVHTYIH